VIHVKLFIKALALAVVAAATLLDMAHARGSERTLAEKVSQAIFDYETGGDISGMADTISELSALSGVAEMDALITAAPDLLNALYGKADRDFDPSRFPRANPSPGGPYPSGIDPEGIKDPKLRAEYEEKLEAERKYAEHYRQQTATFGAIDRLAYLVRQIFKEQDANVVLDALVKNGLSSAHVTDFLKRMEQQAERPQR
jgi:hypothetical protein